MGKDSFFFEGLKEQNNVPSWMTGVSSALFDIR